MFTNGYGAIHASTISKCLNSQCTVIFWTEASGVWLHTKMCQPLALTELHQGYYGYPWLDRVVALERRRPAPVVDTVGC